MKHGIKYGLYLSGVLILLHLLYYFFYPIALYSSFGKHVIVEILLYAVFMFLAISKNKNTYEDSGTFFKIALVTLVIGFIINDSLMFVFDSLLSEELNPIYLEARKADEKAISDLVGQDPLVTLENIELMEKTIDEDMTVGKSLLENLVGVIFIGIPFTILVSYVSRRILKIKTS